MNSNLTSLLRTSLEVYEHLCTRLCKDMGIQQGELHILMFLANNPDKNTAMDIHKCGGMKQSMLSIQVEKLVQGGYLERQPVPEDRRKVKLVCTEKAAPIIEVGREIQKRMTGYMMEGVSEAEQEIFRRVMTTVEENIMRVRAQMLKGELT